jgi:lysine biosynthesis protein LysW
MTKEGSTSWIVKEARMFTVFCIDCEGPIRLESKPTEGEIILCSGCGTEMEVINLEPTELDWVYLEPKVSHEEWSL